MYMIANLFQLGGVMDEAQKGEIDSREAVEIVGLDAEHTHVSWDSAQQGFSWDCPRPVKVHVEMFGGGGGGGGSFRGTGKGGGGGGAGEYKFIELSLDPGVYILQTGIGGRGGRCHQRNEADAPATAGGDSALKSWTGLVRLHCKGGKAGAKDGAQSGSGDNGGDVYSAEGTLISRGGVGGQPDRAGSAPGPKQWGAGGGGGGAFAGPSNYFGGNGSNGHIRIVVVG
jgi:hypothetical protein